MEKVNVNALFLGPKSENETFFTQMLNFMMKDYIDWRKDFHPDDEKTITDEEKETELFKDTVLKTRHALVELAGKLQSCSIPWFSPRYLGHMLTDTLMAANLGYMLTLLYNPNNCAYEGSPATTELELEVGNHLAKLLGYDGENSWGHITSGGTIANYECIWVARNLKSIPFAIKEVLPELVAGQTDWQLYNMTTSNIMDMLEKVKEKEKFKEVRNLSVRGQGFHNRFLGKILVPQTKHYSWLKAADIFGIGVDNLIHIKVTDKYRMDIDDLKSTIDSLVKDEIPILAVIGVIGSTEEASIDEIHRIIDLRNDYEKEGISFYFHIDAAYGGYGRSIFLDEKGEFLSLENLKVKLAEQNIIPEGIDWPDQNVYKAFEATKEADSITVDPHKMGFIPYATGAVVMKDRRILDLVSYFAAYVFDKKEKNPMLLGSYILEGSKAGATVAAAWTAHKLIPLNVTGYGRIIGYGITTAQRFYNELQNIEPIEIEGRSFEVFPLVKPDFNIVNFSFNEVGNSNLDVMNDLTLNIYEQCSYKSGPVYINDFITSKTSLSYDEYDDIPQSFVEKFGITKEEWLRVRSVYVLRSSIMTPFLIDETKFDEFMKGFFQTMKDKIRKIITD